VAFFLTERRRDRMRGKEIGKTLRLKLQRKEK
jgi:hypothetical protein